jgi:hypothetical protein
MPPAPSLEAQRGGSPSGARVGHQRWLPWATLAKTEKWTTFFPSELDLCHSKTREKSALERIIAGKPLYIYISKQQLSLKV